MSYTAYAPRPIEPLGTLEAHGYRLKLYALVYGPAPLDRGAFDAGLAAAVAGLPRPAVSGDRPGLGFSILHRGRTGDYLILCWWDQENELPTRVFVRDRGAWRPARARESFCVWDLEIIWHERCAYVRTMLAGAECGTCGRAADGPADAYLADTIARPAAGQATMTS